MRFRHKIYCPNREQQLAEKAAFENKGDEVAIYEDDAFGKTYVVDVNPNSQWEWEAKYEKK